MKKTKYVLMYDNQIAKQGFFLSKRILLKEFIDETPGISRDELKETKRLDALLRINEVDAHNEIILGGSKMYYKIKE